MKPSKALILTIIASQSLLLNVFAQSQNEAQMLAPTVLWLEMQHRVWEDIGTNHLQVFYHIPNQTDYVPKISQTFGTAFFVQHNAHTYIVTARHVVGDPEDNGVLHLVDTNGLRQDLDLQSIRTALPGAKWFFHQTADIAIHPYFRPTALHVGNSDLFEELISTNPLPLLSPVLALGFPLNLGTIGPKISPIATSCETSSGETTIPGEDPALAFILLDKALAQGYSGAPIFTETKGIDLPGFKAGGGQFYLIGICHSELGDAFGAKHATVVPISRLLEIFQQDDFRKYEAQFRH
jgi:S1-C subfamily serine protease